MFYYLADYEISIYYIKFDSPTNKIIVRLFPFQPNQHQLYPQPYIMKTILAFAALCVAVALAQPRPTPSKGDFRNEFDHLLVSTALSRFHEFEDRLLHLQAEIDHLKVSKSKAEQERIVRELELGINFLSGAHDALDRELKRTDLDLLERFNFESALAVGKVILADLKATEAAVKAIQTSN